MNMAIDIDERKVVRNEFSLWLSWCLATTAGMLLGFVPIALLVSDLDLGLARVLIPLVAGFFVGFLQWLVLREYMTESTDWILSGGASWAVAYALGLFAIQLLAGSWLGALLGYLVFGAIIGLIQWPVLRREIPNALSWILASIIGWGLGAYLSQVVIALFSGGSPVNPVLSTAVIVGVTGLVAGAITGLAFVRIVRQPDRYEHPA
jgi:hypothetical protein